MKVLPYRGIPPTDREDRTGDQAVIISDTRTTGRRLLGNLQQLGRANSQDPGLTLGLLVGDAVTAHLGRRSSVHKTENQGEGMMRNPFPMCDILKDKGPVPTLPMCETKRQELE